MSSNPIMEYVYGGNIIVASIVITTIGIIITVIGGANLSLSERDAENARDILANARVLLLQNEVPWAAAAGPWWAAWWALIIR